MSKPLTYSSLAYALQMGLLSTASAAVLVALGAVIVVMMPLRTYACIRFFNR